MAGQPHQLLPSHPARPAPSTLQFPAERLIEISGDATCARITLAISALLLAQAEGETAAWIQGAGGSLYPPDLEQSGVDLRALAVVHVPLEAGGYGRLRAAELLLRSGAFGIVIVDLGVPTLRPTDTAWQGRLLGLAREHHSRVILLTERGSHVSSLGPLISLRIEPQRRRTARGVFAVESQFIKNKAGLPGHGAVMAHRGPWGLR